jgi:hypothetical protein
MPIHKEPETKDVHQRSKISYIKMHGGFVCAPQNKTATKLPVVILHGILDGGWGGGGFIIFYIYRRLFINSYSRDRGKW